MNNPDRAHKKTQTHKQKSLGFKCVECKHMVPMANIHIGTEHRDHCPYCLYSVHVDGEKPGDRQSSCNSKMKPIGLTFKFNSSELMIVYECLGCGKLHKNRCAGDDMPYELVNIFRQSLKFIYLDEWKNNYAKRLLQSSIEIASHEQSEKVLHSIYGVGYIPNEIREEFHIFMV